MLATPVLSKYSSTSNVLVQLTCSTSSSLYFIFLVFTMSHTSHCHIHHIVLLCYCSFKNVIFGHICWRYVHLKMSSLKPTNLAMLQTPAYSELYPYKFLYVLCTKERIWFLVFLRIHTSFIIAFQSLTLMLHFRQKMS